jgi:hypothetical protein
VSLVGCCRVCGSRRRRVLAILARERFAYVMYDTVKSYDLTVSHITQVKVAWKMLTPEEHLEHDVLEHNFFD